MREATQGDGTIADQAREMTSPVLALPNNLTIAIVSSSGLHVRAKAKILVDNGNGDRRFDDDNARRQVNDTKTPIGSGTLVDASQIITVQRSNHAEKEGNIVYKPNTKRQ